jgi:hypothetical protein
MTPMKQPTIHIICDFKIGSLARIYPKMAVQKGAVLMRIDIIDIGICYKHKTIAVYAIVPTKHLKTSILVISGFT